MTIELSPRVQARITELVEQEHFADAEALIEHALDILDEEKRIQQANDAELKRPIAEGVDAVQHPA